MSPEAHSPQRVLAIANQMADAAGKVILPYFRQAPDVSNKAPDLAFDPVTEADRGAERAIRELIAEHFPHDGILGEEYGRSEGSSGYHWILDPIDGTRSFITGLPQWGTLIALHDGQRAVFGMMDQPFLGERYIGGLTGARCLSAAGGQAPLKVRSCAQLEQAVLMTTCPDMFAGAAREAFDAIRQRVSMTRYGGDCYSYCMLASGHTDLIVETGLQTYDIQALIPVVESAGGIITDWQGGAIKAGGNALAAGDTRCHAQALALLRHLD